jgi:hypothetical protein
VSGEDDLRISPEAVQRITKGLNGAIGELKAVGSSSTDALQGSGFDDMPLTNMEAGHSGLAKSFEDFCERWEWGVRALVQDANEIAARLGLAAGMIHEEDQYWGGTFKVVANAAVGNPHLSEDEVTSKDWDELFNSGTYAPDYSSESFERAGDEAEQVWKDTGRTVMTEGHGGLQTDLMNDVAGIDDETFDRSLDEVFGPSPEDRARQSGADGGHG